MTKYLANLTMVSITPKEIIKETEKQVVFIVNGNERRNAKRTDHDVWCDSFEEARKELIEYRKAKINKLRAQIRHEQEKLKKAKEL